MNLCCLRSGFFRIALITIVFFMGSLTGLAAGVSPLVTEATAADDPSPPRKPVRLIFIHHSSGENWLVDSDGGLGLGLKKNNYFVSDTNYGWGPADQDAGFDTIGDHTDIGYWYNWFAGPHRSAYLKALYAERSKHCDYSRLASNPGGENKIILFKSCFPNSNLQGKPSSPPTTGKNPLRGQDSSSKYMTVANAKGIYNDILKYFKTRPDKLFVVITAPPLSGKETSQAAAANARAFNNWLTKAWLKNYPLKNVGVYDFYNVLTSNGGSANKNDMGSSSGNHHRWWKNQVQHIQTKNQNTSAYPSADYDSHPTQAGNKKAAAEFPKVLNVLYHRWAAGQE